MSIIDLIDTETKGRYDVTPLFANPHTYKKVIQHLCEHLINLEIDLVVGIDALGFILGTSISHQLERGFIPLRKGGKLPCETLKHTFIDYTGEEKSLEIRKDAFQKGQRIIIVDEWVETGAQMTAAIKLVEALGADVVRLVTLYKEPHSFTDQLALKYGFVTLKDWNK